jgi:uncharacterized phage protein (TIGR01671 family)
LREIKFRAKARFSGTIGSDKWLYSSLMRLDAPTHRLNLAGQDCDIETLGQFTGLHDKNGKEIYEGDVVRITAFEDDGDVFIHRIYWDDVSASFKTYGRTDGWDMTVTPESTEVIGNIHESPELLEASC